ncbi:MAG: CoB--CoM heterodisulfide reductase iron-sulfur subunit A family protein [Candidatus Omnitrophica bacterium]|nr:CoB--CoM heterodisulfide reductase iron-sulfur subunit A family protein [Candidatus Omnitrophota bacterium]MBU4590364.1 CoB--CoM heterodisulfide reductase iron-sulfur subunit A family protein [Candidatus Omnitrophota bacterium]
MKIGVFVCHCGTNIAGTVDVERVSQAASKFPKVKHSASYKYMCSNPGQNLVKDAIKKHKLDRIVIASCSPSLHEKTFRKCVEAAGINPYLIEMANIREHCSWVHKDREKATQKAIELTRLAVSKVSRNKPLEKTYTTIEKKVLIIGGGISGIQAAIDIAFANYPAVIVEREPSIGGRMARFDKTFPTLDCAACILTPKMVTVSQSEHVTMHTYSEIEEVSGFVGNFTVKIRKKARSVDINKCTGCGACYNKCPVKVPSEFDMGLGKRKAIYTPFPQAVPNVPVIDRENCLYFKTKKCGICKKICTVGAIDYDMKDEVIEEKFGAIIVATGFNQFDHSVYGEYGYGKHKDMITGLHFERMVNSSGPTGGKIIRPSDGKEVRDVVFIQCVGSRDEQKGLPYCSRLCCMYTAKHALLLREHNKDSQAYVFYIDIRAAGKNYEEFVKKVQDEYGAIYLRGRVSRIFEKGGKLIVRGADTLSGAQIEIKADLVVLATGLVAQKDAPSLAQMLHIPYDKNNLFTEAHPKLAPVETITSGIFLTGACQSPKDIPDTVATASAASVKALGLMVQDKLAREPLIASVNQDLCSGCLACLKACPFSAIEEDEIEDRKLRRKRTVAKVREAVCTGCGNCTAVCRMAAIDLEGFTNTQIMEEVETL